MKSGSRKPDGSAASKSSGDSDPPFDVMKAEWAKANKLRRAWDRASPSERTRFVTKVLKYTLKDED